jgi:transposase
MVQFRLDSAECATTNSPEFWIGRVTECFDTKSMKQIRRWGLWVRRKRGNRKLICSGCGRKFTDAHDYYQREVRDLPWRKYQTTVIIELYRVCCPQCGVRVEKVPQLPSKAPFSKDFEDAVGIGVRKRLGTIGGPTVPPGC